MAAGKKKLLTNGDKPYIYNMNTKYDMFAIYEERRLAT